MRRVARSIQERSVFIDTSAFLALAAVNDSRHRQSIQVLDRIRIGQYFLCTTKFVRYETHAGILGDISADAARTFLREMAKTATRLTRVSGRDEEAARQIIFTHTDKDYSLCDATSFAVMRRLGISLAFTFDDHFKQHGFSTPLDYDDWPE